MTRRAFYFVGYDLPNSRMGAKGLAEQRAEFASMLRKFPNEWAIWPRPQEPRVAKATRVEILKGGYPEFPKGEYEAALREGILHVKYVGGPA